MGEQKITVKADEFSECWKCVTGWIKERPFLPGVVIVSHSGTPGLLGQVESTALCSPFRWAFSAAHLLSLKGPADRVLCFLSVKAFKPS